MNCADCQDNLVACMEGLLDSEQFRQCQAHLESCLACRTEYAGITRLQKRLVAGGRVGSEVSLVEPVMRRVRQAQRKPERTTIMSTLLKYRWGFGLGAAASAAIIAFVIAVAVPNAQARAVEVMARGARAVARLTTIHFRGQLRTYPQDNFSYINADCPFYTIELWKQFEPELKWRVEKPKRVVVMDGESALMLIKTDDTAQRFPHRVTSGFDTEWLHRIANLSNTITNELKNALAKGWKLSLAEETGADGRVKSVVTVLARSGVPENDYLKNAFFQNADTRRVYRFDAQSELLESVQVYLSRSAGEVQIFDLSQIDYNQPIDSTVWQLELPADVSWVQEPQKLPDNEKYVSMTAEQAARAFLEACGREDWNEAGKYMSPLNERLKQSCGGLEIASLGQSFTSKAYGGRFVPYEIKLRPQEFNVRVSNANPAKRYVITGIYSTNLQPMQELKWTNAPEVLPNNDAYAKLSPAEVVTACFAAWAKFDWDEMRKFDPAYDVEEDKAKVEAAEKNGVDVHKIFPVMEAGQAFWSPEQSAWFVKCRAVQVKKWNMAVRKDNPAGRWQVDGGL